MAITSSKKIFVSYRRDDDGAYFVPVLNQRLTRRYGEGSVFYDIDNIPLGVDFRSHLSDAISTASIVLAVIGDRWMGYDANSGLRRIDREDDFVRIEIEAALDRDIPVVPILVGKASMPCDTELPPSIAKLAFRNAAEVRTGKDYELHFAQLEKGLDAHFLQSEIPRSPPQLSAAENSIGPVCNECGVKNPQASKFCQGCGKPLSVIVPQVSKEPAVPLAGSRLRLDHPDGSVVFLEHRQVWVGYAEGRIVCTKKSSEKAVEFLKERFGLDGQIVRNM
jgi:hypothetical protein